MLSHRNLYFERDFTFLRRLLIRSQSDKSAIKLVTHRLDNVVTFSIKTEQSEEVFPLLFSDIKDLLSEAKLFLADYDLRIDDAHGEQKEYQVSK